MLSDKTCNDMDFEELFMFIDRTRSKEGQQYLYKKLRVIPLNSCNSSGNVGLNKKLYEDPDQRINAQMLLNSQA